ncbi:TPA: hypothetical protein I8V99_000255 [Corynebacterium striatum]|nr:hypothetical protein [Corynebacterium striatum]
MTKRKLPICVRPNCTRAVTHSKDYDGLCFHHAKTAGIAHHLVPWHKVHAELERLINGGWTLNAIEEDYLVFNTTLRDIKYHKRDRASLRTSGDTNKRQPITPEFLNKLESLVSHYGINKAASVIGINAKTINRIRQGQSQHTNEKVTLRIEDSYDELRIRGGQAA